MKTNIKCIDQSHGRGWSLYHGDSCEIIKAIPDNSIHFTIYSPPFESLYTYSNSVRDMGNSKDRHFFWQHFKFLIAEQFRTTIPGRLCSVHCMNLPTAKANHGYIGIRDFRGEIIREFENAGFIYHSEVCIWKDPVTAMQRTKALGLLHKQMVKDSAMSRQGIADYLVTFRKPGKNPEPIAGCFDSYCGDGLPPEGLYTSDKDTRNPYSIEVWQRYASPVWMDIDPSDTLQHRSAREDDDERHICPLQLQVIQRAMDMWSNPGDTVASWFAGIGSEGHVALKMGRKFVGCELKPSYFKQAALNLAASENVQQFELPI